jgi:hypothetical protein
VNKLLGIRRFIRSLTTKLRFGKRSRACLKLLELRLRGELAECDWMARPPDVWDSDLPVSVRERNAASQALEDAMEVRELLFKNLSEVRTADVRVYRPCQDGHAELIIAGTVTREQCTRPEIRSLVMRAKLCGFRFTLNNGVLDPLDLQGVGQQEK